jgi:hypothetical protein
MTEIKKIFSDLQPYTLGNILPDVKDCSYLCNSKMIMSGFSKVEMSGFAIIFPFYRKEGKDGRTGHYYDEHKRVKKVKGSP